MIKRLGDEESDGAEEKVDQEPQTDLLRPVLEINQSMRPDEEAEGHGTVEKVTLPEKLSLLLSLFRGVLRPHRPR